MDFILNEWIQIFFEVLENLKKNVPLLELKLIPWVCYYLTKLNHLEQKKTIQTRGKNNN